MELNCDDCNSRVHLTFLPFRSKIASAEVRGQCNKDTKRASQGWSNLCNVDIVAIIERP